MGLIQSRGRELDAQFICVHLTSFHHCVLITRVLSSPLCADADDQTGTVQRPRAEGAELGALPAQVPPQEPDQAKGTQEEERQEGIHALPALAARQQGMLLLFLQFSVTTHSEHLHKMGWAIEVQSWI